MSIRKAAVGLRSQARSGPPYGLRIGFVVMPNYKRFHRNGGIYFFTVVTHERRGFLTDADARGCLHAAIETEQGKRPFELTGIVLLPDHLHTVWMLPDAIPTFPFDGRKSKNALRDHIFCSAA